MIQKPEEGQIFNIPGIDSEYGIASTGGTAAGYRKVLSTFSRDVKERLLFFSSYLKEEINEKKVSLFAVYAHSLKSALSFIGAQELSEQAKALEIAGKAGDNGFISENLPDFTEKLSELIKNILIAIDIGSKNEAEEEPISPECTQLLQELVDLIKSRAAFSKIDNIIEELDKNAVNSRLREALEQVSDEVLMAEYDNALQIIQKIL